MSWCPLLSRILLAYWSFLQSISEVGRDCDFPECRLNRFWPVGLLKLPPCLSCKWIAPLSLYAFWSNQEVLELEHDYYWASHISWDPKIPIRLVIGGLCWLSNIHSPWTWSLSWVVLVDVEKCLWCMDSVRQAKDYASFNVVRGSLVFQKVIKNMFITGAWQLSPNGSMYRKLLGYLSFDTWILVLLHLE